MATVFDRELHISVNGQETRNNLRCLLVLLVALFSRKDIEDLDVSLALTVKEKEADSNAVSERQTI